jgi:hypothetical protein
MWIVSTRRANGRDSFNGSLHRIAELCGDKIARQDGKRGTCESAFFVDGLPKYRGTDDTVAVHAVRRATRHCAVVEFGVSLAVVGEKLSLHHGFQVTGEYAIAGSVTKGTNTRLGICQV